MRSEIPRISMQLSRGVLVASIQVDLDDNVIVGFQQDLLERIQATGARGVILDLSGLELLDAEEFEALVRIIHMGRLMGAETIVAGLRPGVVSALVETATDLDGVRAALHVDAAFDLLAADQAQRNAGTEESPRKADSIELEARTMEFTPRVEGKA